MANSAGLITQSSRSLTQHQNECGDAAEPAAAGGVEASALLIHSDVMPLYLVTLFGKNEQSDLSAEQCNQLADLAEQLRLTWIRKKR